MSVSRLKWMVLLGLSLVCCAIGTAALAASGAATGGVGGVAAHVRGNLSDIAKLITAGSYVAGMGFAVAAIVKFKAHKEQPTQIPVGTPIVLLFVAAALLFAPSVFKTSGETLFKSGQTGGISGTVNFT
jgi:intracellular multiplication protein IcmD